MATLAQTVLTYADWAKRLDPNGRIDTIVEMLQQTNPVLEDMLVMQANNGTNHKTTVRTGIPSGAWRLLNYGVPKVKTRTAQVQDTTGMLEAYSEVDRDLARLSGDQARFRLSEARGIMEGMNQQMASTLFYGNTAINPERFLGLTPRYSTLNTAVAQSAENVIDAGGATPSEQTSIWIVTWGSSYTHGLFPQGSQAGLQHRDLGEVTIEDAQGGLYQGYRDHFKWDLGLTVRDWRFNYRICNIDVPSLTTPAYIEGLIEHLIMASEMMDPVGDGRTVIYANKRVRAALRFAILEKIGNNLTWDNVAGRRVMSFDGVPIRRTDAILNTEAVVT
jgi:hypothetical protein